MPGVPRASGLDTQGGQRGQRQRLRAKPSRDMCCQGSIRAVGKVARSERPRPAAHAAAPTLGSRRLLRGEQVGEEGREGGRVRARPYILSASLQG